MYNKPVCRGSLQLGTGCGSCERCIEQITQQAVKLKQEITTPSAKVRVSTENKLKLDKLVVSYMVAVGAPDSREVIMDLDKLWEDMFEVGL